MAPQRVGRINCRGDYGFGRRHSQLRARQRENHLHVHGRAGAGIEIGGQRDDGARFNQVARGRFLRQAKMKIAARKQSADDIRICERANISAINFFEMIGACRSHFHGQARGARARELLGVNPGRQPVHQSGSQDMLGLRDA